MYLDNLLCKQSNGFLKVDIQKLFFFFPKSMPVVQFVHLAYYILLKYSHCKVYDKIIFQHYWRFWIKKKTCFKSKP